MEAQQPTQTINSNSEEGKKGEEEFYENIEAPKFVDFTISDDPFRPDDRYWFCLRVGCDRKHEEEMDPEEISKIFVLRVLAARSPNIRFRKALNKRNTSTNAKCPLSAPVKASKPRVSRLAMVSSMSQKMLDVSGKIRTPPKISSTSPPVAKVKQVASKYMTTPRNKRCLPNPNSFRSVQNPRPSNIQVPKSHTVVKALFFRSPKKAITLKTSVELSTPLTKLCEGMKRLEITSQRKRVLGYSSKSSKETRCHPRKTLPVNPSRKQLGARKDKSKVKDLLPRHNCKDREAKSVRNVKSKSNQMVNKCGSMPKEMSKFDSSDMEIDVKSRDGSALDSSRIIEGEAQEELLNSRNIDSTDSEEEILVSNMLPLRKNPDTLTNNATRGEMNSLPNSDERDLEGMDLPTSHPLNDKEVEGSEGIEQEGNTKLSSDNEKSRNDLQILQGVGHESEVTDSDGKENAEASDENRCSSEGIEKEDDTKLCSEDKGSYKDHQTLQVVGHEIEEVKDGDDKENAQASDGSRDFSNNNRQPERRILSRQETHAHESKVVQTFDKNKKDGLTSAITGAPNVKYRKPKPTNPKPFRLRTDERGILKEANMERKIPAPQKEAATVLRCLGGNSQRCHGNDIKQKNEKCSELSKCRNDECCNKESVKKVQKVESKWSKIVGLKSSSNGQAGPKLATRTPERRLKPLHPEPNSTTTQHEHSKDNASQKLENNSRKTTLQRQLVRPQGKHKTSLITPEQPLSVIKETSSTTKFNETGKAYESAATLETKATAFAASRSLSQGRRKPFTTPKEPNFHSPNVPESCTRNTA